MQGIGTVLFERYPMENILLPPERVKNLIALGESEIREFKSAFQGPDDAKKPGDIKILKRYIAETLVAFGNADGGELIIGVEDDGTLTGVPHTVSEIQDMLNGYGDYLHKDTKSVLSPTQLGKVEVDGKLLLFFSILKGTTDVYQLSDGKCVRRRGKENAPATFREINFPRQEARSRMHDQHFRDEALVTDLDLAVVQAVANESFRGLGVERYLQQTRLAEYGGTGLRLREAALLLFAKDIQRWHPRSQVRILKVNGTELKAGVEYNVTSDDTVTGNILELLTKAWDRLKSYLVTRTEFGADAKFEQRYLYPEQACQEALVNAIAHRDYTIQNGIEVYLFTDRLEIKSPGALLSTITVKDLEEQNGVHESRNALIARVLRDSHSMRELGEGIKRIFEDMQQADLEKPKLYSNTTSFSVTLFNRSIFTDNQERWLSLFKDYQLTRLQRRIIAAGMDGRQLTRDDINKAMGTKDRDVYDRELTPLRNKGLVQASGQGKDRKFRVILPTTITPTATPPLIRDEDRRKLFVKNLPLNPTVAELQALFSEFGKVDIQIRANDYGYFAFITLDSAHKVEPAIAKLNGYKLRNSSIVVEKYRRGES
jgi:ATP-dependent DNA helicase RecG